jgi:hypothetical protein
MALIALAACGMPAADTAAHHRRRERRRRHVRPSLARGADADGKDSHG